MSKKSTCTCGAHHTSNPSYHLSYCDVNKCSVDICSVDKCSIGSAFYYLWFDPTLIQDRKDENIKNKKDDSKNKGV